MERVVHMLRDYCHVEREGPTYCGERATLIPSRGVATQFLEFSASVAGRSFETKGPMICTTIISEITCSKCGRYKKE